jgi:alpha-glucosidase
MILLAVLCLLSSVTLSSRDSRFTRHGAGPKYWMAYEYCWATNSPIPESVWKANIDWVDTTFKSYGYDMICNDGWIEGAQTIDINGYITKYNDAWVHTFKYWADYLAKKGMKLGVYYNPMWMTKAAYDKNVTVKGTSAKARDIAGVVSFNEPLYWVDTDKKGAKEWIQGYVKYFIELGATYLRIDFLENYERNYGTAKYRQALAWIEEAAGDAIFLSLVMPNCFEHGKTELLYGDMIRIDDDCFDGGWDFVSDRRRGQQKAIWPQYGNAFDGFIGFADIGGKGQMILDGDFMRLNTMANDKERVFLFSLMVMTGSALAIADQYNTIGEHAWVYQNRELLALNEQGFAGKPLSYDHREIGRSSTWAGQLPNGDWIVGLFNREDTTQVRHIDFENDLGIDGGYTANIRDLWTHADLGSKYGGYSVTLAPHECKIICIKNSSGE